MKYLIIGAGGTGGTLGFYMTKAKKEVTLIARNEHLNVMKSKGLTLEKLWNHEKETLPVKAVSMEEYQERPDVILVCVKGYSLDSVIPFIQKIAKPETIVIPILNIYGTGGRMQKLLPKLSVMDGCIYVSANISSYGTILQHGKILRVVYGARTPEELRPELKEIQKDFFDSSIEGILSDQIKRDTLKKFSYVSPIGAAGLYWQATAGEFQKEGEPREMFKAKFRNLPKRWGFLLNRTMLPLILIFCLLFQQKLQLPCRETSWHISHLNWKDLSLKLYVWVKNTMFLFRCMKRSLKN